MSAGVRLRFQGVSFAWNADRLALDGIDFELAPGSLAAVVGPNGSGKSTLARLAAGLLVPVAGQVELDGANASRLPPLDRARRVALLPQGPTVPFPVRGIDLVLTGRYPHLGPWRSETSRDWELARRALEQVGASELADREIHTLSGGERQRVFLARALAQEPELLVADEPTTHLDLAHATALAAVFVELVRKRSVGLLLVTHDLDLAASLADRVLVLDRGRLVADGAPRETLSPELVERVFGARVEWVSDSSGRPRLLVAAR